MDVLEICAKMIRDAVGTMSTKFSAHVKDEINAKVSTLYKPGGAATLATLPALTADNAGYVYDMSEAFTTTASFREGAGHKYPAGTNVVISDVGGDVYKYDVLSGMLDGYVQESRKVGNVPLSADIPVTLTGDTAITVTNTGTASAIGYSVTHNDSGVTAGSKGDATNQTPGFGGTFKVLSATVDTKGHVTALGDHTVKVPSDTATTSKDGLMSKTDKTKLDAMGVTASNPLEVTKTGETYNVVLKDSGVTAGTKGDTTNQTPGFGGTFKVLSATVDTKGRVTNLAEHSVKTPDAEATQSAKGLMSASDKTKLDTLVDDTLSATGKAADAKVTGDNVALLKELIQGIDAPIYRKASGNPATFFDADAANVKALSVTITPTQSGSGTPSPSNIRPITGLQSISTTRTGKNLLKTLNVSNQYVKVNADGSVEMIQPAPGNQSFIMGHAQLKGGTAYKLTWPISSSFRVFIEIDGEFTGPDMDNMGIFTPSYDQKSEVGIVYGNVAAGTKMYPMVYISNNPPSEYEPYQGQTVTVSLVDSNSNPLTVYGGTLNVTTGKLTVTHTSKTLTGIGRYYTDEGSYRRFLTTAMDNGKSNLSSSYSVLSNMSTDKWVSGAPVNVVISSGSNRGSIYIRNDLVSADTAAGNAWLAEHPLQIYYPLETPVSYQLTPQQLATLSGYNSVTTDAGTLSVTYRADPSITLGGG